MLRSFLIRGVPPSQLLTKVCFHVIVNIEFSTFSELSNAKPSSTRKVPVESSPAFAIPTACFPTDSAPKPGL